jgi:aminoacrylate hydrolase
MYFEVIGPTDRPAVLLSSGLGGAAGYWQPQMAALSAQFRLVLYDHRGTGRSFGELPEGYSIADMAAEAREVLAQAGIERCHVIGHALGGLIGLALALAAPDVVDRLVLINAWAKIDAHTRRCFAARLALLDGSGVSAYVEAQPIFLYPAWWLSQHADQVQREVAQMIAHFPGAASVKRRIAALSAFDITQDLARITQPTLLISAMDDILVPHTASEALWEGLPHARLTCLPSGGHACNVTFPDPFNELCLGFLQAGAASC